jgi:hypothetical protein
MHKKNLHPAAPNFQLKRKKRERRRKWVSQGVSAASPCRISPLGLTGRGSHRPKVLFFVFFFCFSVMGLTAPRHRCPSLSLYLDTSWQPTSQQVDDWPPRPTVGSRWPWVWFFLGFRMIKSQKWLTFPHMF